MAGKTNKKSSIQVALLNAVFLSLTYSHSSWPAFYQSGTMADYCKEYVKMISLEKPYNQLEAGICSGYIASKIEVMDLSGELCQRDNVNLDEVVNEFIAHVSRQEDDDQSATYRVVEVLQHMYACTRDS